MNPYVMAVKPSCRYFPEIDRIARCPCCDNAFKTLYFYHLHLPSWLKTFLVCYPPDVMP